MKRENSYIRHSNHFKMLSIKSKNNTASKKKIMQIKGEQQTCKIREDCRKERKSDSDIKGRAQPNR